MPTLLALDRVLARRTVDTLGRYQLLGRLGSGGMAEVFVARCGEVPGMQSLLAVKRILPHLADDEKFVALFRREAQISLRLRHRAIARVLEVGRAGPSWFLAMELVAGESLSHLLRAEREMGSAVDPRLVAWVGAEIASALHHAHALTDGTSSMEVIHRDVSPQNLLLGFDGTAKLIDFGVARCIRFSDATRTGTVRGKLAYASPEQLSSRSLDGRSDLFSLAIVLHEWLAGVPLFARESDAATVHAVQTALIPPLPQAPRLGTVLARALERSPERRYPDGESLAEALLDAVGNRPAAPERLVADHLATLFPDRKLRWQAITAGHEVNTTSLELVHPVRGDTAPGTPRLSRRGSSLRAGAGKPVRQLLRQRSTLAFVASAGLAILLFSWMRHGHGVVVESLAPTPTRSKAAWVPAPEMARLASAVTPASDAPIRAPVAPILAPSDPPHARVKKKFRHPSARADRSDSRYRALIVPQAPNINQAVPAQVRNAVVDELERSPYATPR